MFCANPIQFTVPPVLGLGLHVIPGIVKLVPDATAAKLKLTFVPLFPVDGVTVGVGILGTLVSIVNPTELLALTFPALSVNVITANKLPVLRPLVDTLQFPLPSTTPVKVSPSTTTVTIVPISPVPLNTGFVIAIVDPLNGLLITALFGALLS